MPAQYRDTRGMTSDEFASQQRRIDYEKALAARKPAEQSEVADGSEPKAATNAAGITSGVQEAQAGAQQGNGMSTLGGGLMAAGAVPTPASPYLLAAGAVVSMAGSAEQNKRNQEQADRKAYNDRITQRQQLMTQIASQGIA